MLEIPQVPISVVQFGSGIFSYPRMGRQSIKGLRRFFFTQCRISATCNKLLGLRKKLNFPNTTSAKLDVMACNSDIPMAFVHMNLPFD